MAGDPRQVSAGNGVAGIADILNLLGGRTERTQNTADTSGLQALQGELQSPDFAGLLQSVFQQAAGQTPGLQSRMSNAVGARSGQNGALQAALQKLLQDTTIQAQGQLVQQNHQNQQLRGQVAGQIAGATGGRKTESGTNMGKAATTLGALQAVGALKPDNLKKAYDGVSGFFNSGGGQLGSTLGEAGNFIDLGNFSVGGDVAGSAFGDVGFGEAASGLGDLFQSADFASDLGSTIDFSSAAADTADVASIAGESNMFGDAWDGITDFFGFADGGLIGRDGKRTIVRRHLEEAEDRENAAMGFPKSSSKAEDDAETKATLAKMNASRNPKTGKASDDYDKSSKLVDKATGIRFANGGEVSSRAGGGRRSSAPGYTPDTILQSIANQGRGNLNPARPMGGGNAARQQSTDPDIDGGGLENTNGFSMGSGNMNAAVAAKNEALIQSFAKALLTQSPLSFAKTAVGTGLSQMGFMDDIGKSPDPIASLAVAQGWLGPGQAANVGSDALAAAANAISGFTNTDPMESLMGITDAFGTAQGAAVGEAAEGGLGTGGYDGGLGGGFGGFGGFGGDGFGGDGIGSEGASGDGAAESGGDGAAESGFKDGGKLAGPGTGTSDSIHARVSKGEYIVPADVVSTLGVQFFDDLRANFHTFVDEGQ